MRRALLVLMAAGLLFAAGCGEDEEATPTGTSTTTATAETTAVRVYFLRDGKVWPVRREVKSATQAAMADEALEALAAGPSESERQLEMSSAVPGDFASSGTNSAARGHVAIATDQRLSRPALAQVVYTLSELAVGPPRMGLNERFYAPSDFEDLTPAILVESPLAFDEVTSPLRVTGTANTFEATFQYDLTDTDGRIVDSNFVTATSGTGTRGTFDFTTDEFTVPFDGIGALIVYELSAKDGQTRLHLVEIPLEMSK